MNRPIGRTGRERPSSPDGAPGLVYDWNESAEFARPPAGAVKFDDETLRDGLQSPSAVSPPVATEIELLHHMEALGIDRAAIGYPGSGPQALADTIAMAQEVGRAGLRIGVDCAGRTAPADILPIAEAQERSGVPITARLFIGSSAIRQLVDSWDPDFLLRTAEDAVGHITPWGVQNLIRFMRGVVADTGEPVEIDWHGHRDRGLEAPPEVVERVLDAAKASNRVLTNEETHALLPSLSAV